MNNRYYFLRHAEADRSLDLPNNELPLTDFGNGQASDLISRINELDIDLIFSSPFKRALQTVTPTADYLDLDVYMQETLQGRDIGALKKDQLWDFLKASWEDFDLKQSGCESAKECQARMSAFIAELEMNYQNKNILVVSHSNVIATYLSQFSEEIDFDWFKNMKSPALFTIQEGLAKEIRLL